MSHDLKEAEGFTKNTTTKQPCAHKLSFEQQEGSKRSFGALRAGKSQGFGKQLTQKHDSPAVTCNQVKTMALFDTDATQGTKSNCSPFGWPGAHAGRLLPAQQIGTTGCNWDMSTHLRCEF